jgi:hypothetical protein
VAYVASSPVLRVGAAALLDRAVDLAARLIATNPVPHDHRAGRKASGLLVVRPREGGGAQGPATPPSRP